MVITNAGAVADHGQSEFAYGTNLSPHDMFNPCRVFDRVIYSDHNHTADTEPMKVSFGCLAQRLHAVP